MHRNTIVRIESGEALHGPGRVQRALEDAGIVFLPAVEGMHGPAVALKWGQPEPRPSLKSRTDKGEDGGSLQASCRLYVEFRYGCKSPKMGAKPSPRPLMVSERRGRA